MEDEISACLQATTNPHNCVLQIVCKYCNTSIKGSIDKATGSRSTGQSTNRDDTPRTCRRAQLREDTSALLLPAMRRCVSQKAHACKQRALKRYLQISVLADPNTYYVNKHLKSSVNVLTSICSSHKEVLSEAAMT